MPRYRGMDISNTYNYDNQEFQNFNFFKHLCPKEDFPEFYKEEKKDEDIEEITKQMSNINLNTMKVSQLKRMCKDNGIKGYSKLKKNELVELLKDLKL